MITSEEAAKKLIEIDKRFYLCLTRFNELKSRREKILSQKHEYKISNELKKEMKESIKGFDEVLKEMQELEKQTNILKQYI